MAHDSAADERAQIINHLGIGTRLTYCGSGYIPRPISRPVHARARTELGWLLRILIAIGLCFFAASVSQAGWQVAAGGDAIVRSDDGFIRMGCRLTDDPDDLGILTMIIFEPRANWVAQQKIALRFETDTGHKSIGKAWATAAASHLAVVGEGDVLWEFSVIKRAQRSFILRGDDFERTYSAEDLMSSLSAALKKCRFESPWID
jgi:hypothetical protein